jgi:hypothetical protein
MNVYRIAAWILAAVVCGTAQAAPRLRQLPAAIAILLLSLASSAAYGGSIRYELAALFGKHSYDGGLSLFNVAQQIETPFGFYAVEEARLVVEGRVSKGQASGDGVIREGSSFELLPSVGVRPSFANSIDITTEPTLETFRIETLYPDPFVPDTTPLPNPDGYPPVSFSVYLSVSPAFGTQYPPLIGPPGDTLSALDGIEVDVPIIATIERAYIVLSGASIVPEPGSVAMLGGFLVLLLGARYRVARNALLVVIVPFLGETCHAEFTFLPPTPYLSVADSPFPVSSNPSFHLEDFEDDPGCVPGPGSFCGGGKFDAPGVRMIHGSTASGASVDADDGVIDGSGADGASAVAVTVFTNPDLTFWFDAIQFDFDSSELGYLPTAVGFVLTAGAGSMSGLTVYDGQGNSTNFDTSNLLLNPSTTSDDRFIGITNPNGISSLVMGRTILAASGDFASPRLDHLQYGLWIPEPSATALVCSALAAFFCAGWPRQANKLSPVGSWNCPVECCRGSLSYFADCGIMDLPPFYARQWFRLLAGFFCRPEPPRNRTVDSTRPASLAPNRPVLCCQASHRNKAVPKG